MSNSHHVCQHTLSVVSNYSPSTEHRLAAARKTITPQMNAQRTQLIERYGVLFRGRHLVCRRCLGVRYGEVKKYRRQAKRMMGVKTPRKVAKRLKRAATLTAQEKEGLRQSRAAMKSIHESNAFATRVLRMEKALSTARAGDADAKRQAGGAKPQAHRHRIEPSLNMK